MVFWKESFQGRAREMKQSNKKKKLSLFMPLVAPVRGVQPKVVWAKEWQKVAAEAGSVLSKTPVGPLLPATAPRWRLAAEVHRLGTAKEPRPLNSEGCHTVLETQCCWVVEQIRHCGRDTDTLVTLFDWSFEYISLLKRCP